jgi:hypothetical protein
MQDAPKFTQSGFFGFENVPSGNPAYHPSLFLANVTFSLIRKL